jgi:hypothetical protein
MGGQVQVLFASVPGLTSEKTERARPIAMAELKRSALMPDLPTMSESGLPGSPSATGRACSGPAGLDASIVKKLHDEVLAILATDEMKARIKTLGLRRHRQHAGGVRQQLQEDVERWGRWRRCERREEVSSIDPVERRLILHQHALDILPGGAEQVVEAGANAGDNAASAAAASRFAGSLSSGLSGPALSGIDIDRRAAEMAGAGSPPAPPHRQCRRASLDQHAPGFMREAAPADQVLVSGSSGTAATPRRRRKQFVQ